MSCKEQRNTSYEIMVNNVDNVSLRDVIIAILYMIWCTGERIKLSSMRKPHVMYHSPLRATPSVLKAFKTLVEPLQ